MNEATCPECGIPMVNRVALNADNVGDFAWLVATFYELHRLPPSSRQRDYLRGRIDEFCAQNAVPPEKVAEARAWALTTIQEERI